MTAYSMKTSYHMDDIGFTFEQYHKRAIHLLRQSSAVKEGVGRDRLSKAKAGSHSGGDFPHQYQVSLPSDWPEVYKEVKIVDEPVSSRYAWLSRSRSGNYMESI